MDQATVFERGDHIYIVGPVTPFGPGDNEIEEYAFAEQLKSTAPNSNLLWLRGQYVEADRPNLNGQQWAAGELALKALTPMFMPVTVMHDPRTAVGLIADTKLLLPGEAAEVERSRIDTTMAVWQHRFPEIAAEVDENYKAGTLMQSMECQSPHYSCVECGKLFPKLPGNAEEEMWCEHLAGVGGDGSSRAGRILGNVTFTGTGLIFGTRGAQGAYDEAHLDVFQDEIAEFHAEAKQPTPHRAKRSSTSMEISQEKYDELMARPSKEDLAAAETRATEAEQKATEAEAAKATLNTEKEAAEVAQKAAEDKVTDLEEKANAATLATERVGKLGKDFKAKLPEGIREKLVGEQAKSLSDEDWTARLEELASLTGVKPDEGGAGEAEAEEFSADEVASAQVGNQPGASKAPSTEQRGSVVRGLAGL